MTSEPGAPPPFDCRVEPDRDTVWIRPVGEIDMATAAEVQARLDEVLEVGFTRLVLDLRETTFMDSTGLHLVITWQQRSRAERFAFAVVQGPEPIRRVFEVAGAMEQIRFIDVS
jgi:anti-sigma B factor antagonist